MINVGEQFVSSYLRYIRQCSFTQTNLYTIESQGEIDVVGLNIEKQQVYICEVAIHLTNGLLYNKNNRPDNVQKLTDKFSRDIEYARNYFDGYEQFFMLWSPIVKDSKGKTENNQMIHLSEIQDNIKRKYSIDIECIVNEKFQECLDQLKNYAKSQTKALQCPLMRLMQIEEYLGKHVSKYSDLHNQSSYHNASQPTIDLQNEESIKEYSEFWQPVRKGNFGVLFKGKPVPVRNEGCIGKSINRIKVNLFLNKQNCYIQLLFTGDDKIEKRDQVMKLFSSSDYKFEYKDSPKEAKANFPILEKGKNHREEWDEIREALVRIGTDIYNKIKDSNL
ncbi:hypothetical protein JT359_06480 [Candidatus Poribacteria bacterium]|nr:hypothetical protein [Candidatus Poribacteria bacterium]